ncbi:MAG: dienelactone hydrolase family protein [Micromonosporaceae bacterium]
MAEIALFHSVLGVRPGVHEAAERFRAVGHTVHVIDLYGGRSFDDYEQGAAYVDSLGGPEALVPLTVAAIADLPTDLVYAGFSNGAGSAIVAGATRPGARGVLAFHGAMPLHVFGAESWPSTVPLQAHQAEHDPMQQPEWVEEFLAAVRDSGATHEYFVYPGVSGHQFADPSLSDEYDSQAAELLYQRSLAFLQRVST